VTKKHSIFLSYASPDRERVLPYYDFLKSNGLQVWMDKHNIAGGQDWDFEIKRALNRASLIIIFISENSIDRRGYIQREIKLALNRSQEMLVGDIFIIPVLLDNNAGIPDQLAQIQVISGEESEIQTELLKSIGIQFENLRTEEMATQEAVGISWTKNVIEEEWDGTPGYHVYCEIVNFRSQEYQKLDEINSIVGGWIASAIQGERAVKLDQNNDLFNFGQDQFMRHGFWEATIDKPNFVGRVMSLPYKLFWHGASAAHPNTGFQTFNFLLDPLVQIDDLGSLFNFNIEALAVLKKEIESQLLVEGKKREIDVDYFREQIRDGLRDWESLNSFIFAEDGIEFLFGPYHVAPYALGSWFATIPYSDVKEHMLKPYQDALGISSQ